MLFFLLRLKKRGWSYQHMTLMECFPVISRWWIIFEDKALEQSKFVLRVSASNLSSVLCGGSRNRVALMRPTSPVDHGLTFLCPWVPPSDSLTIDFSKTKAHEKSTVNVTASFSIGVPSKVCKRREYLRFAVPRQAQRWWEYLRFAEPRQVIIIDLTLTRSRPRNAVDSTPWKSVNVIASHPIRHTETTFLLWPTIDRREQF